MRVLNCDSAAAPWGGSSAPLRHTGGRRVSRSQASPLSTAGCAVVGSHTEPGSRPSHAIASAARSADPVVDDTAATIAGRLSCCRPAARPRRRRLADGAPRPGERRASPLSAQDVLQHRLVERQVGHKPLQLGILLLKLLQPPDLNHAHSSELLIPPVERGLGDPELAADLPNSQRNCQRSSAYDRSKATRGSSTSSPSTSTHRSVVVAMRKLRYARSTGRNIIQKDRHGGRAQRPGTKRHIVLRLLDWLLEFTQSRQRHTNPSSKLVFPVACPHEVVRGET